ncbi:MAG TPA: CYTH and CHAD domain-containing protein [Mycobacteriales bacterium]|nr:CYTH and CHAD domain-containing protein [Mycobacteriales bacterium]
MGVEVERKFTVHGLYALPTLTNPEAGVVNAVPSSALDLRATYYDTADLRLAREGITLRHRTGENPARWTLKLPLRGGGAHTREEIDVVGTARSVPEEIADLLTAWTRGASVEPVAVLRTRRRPYVLSDADDVVLGELVDDTVSVLEGRRVVARFREIEIEGEETPGLLWLGSAIRDAGAVAGEFVPKAIRALGARASAPPDLPVATEVRKNDPAGDVVTQSLRANVRRLVLADVGVRRDIDDAVHQMRVACRRMRSELKTFGSLVDATWADRLREELSWLADELGAARDFEVLAERIAAVSADPAAPLDPAPVGVLLDELSRRQQGAAERVGGALRSPRYVALVDELIRAAQSPPLTAAAERPAGVALPPLVRVTWQQLARSARRLRADQPAERFHRTRILAKRARYAAEACAPVLGAPADRLAKACASVQSVLGEMQDGAVAADFVREVAAAHPGNGGVSFAAGQLVERERHAALRTQEALLGLWPQIDRKRIHGWLSG